MPCSTLFRSDRHCELDHRTAVAPSGLWVLWVVGDLGLANSASPSEATVPRNPQVPKGRRQLLRDPRRVRGSNKRCFITLIEDRHCELDHRTAVAPSGLWVLWVVGDLGLANSASPRLHAFAPSGHFCSADLVAAARAHRSP